MSQFGLFSWRMFSQHCCHRWESHCSSSMAEVPSWNVLLEWKQSHFWKCKYSSVYQWYFAITNGMCTDRKSIWTFWTASWRLLSSSFFWRSLLTVERRSPNKVQVGTNGSSFLKFWPSSGTYCTGFGLFDGVFLSSSTCKDKKSNYRVQFTIILIANRT